MAYAAYVEPSIILTAFLGTATIFGAFSLSAMLSKRRSLLYIGAISSSILSMLLLGSLLSFFLPWQVFTELNLYLGLAAFMGYVVYDTQVIIERSEALGDAPKGAWSGSPAQRAAPHTLAAPPPPGSPQTSPWTPCSCSWTSWASSSASSSSWLATPARSRAARGAAGAGSAAERRCPAAAVRKRDQFMHVTD